jgi:radical SAM superfamily enzyme YgiQ (UPF0313 family)
MRLVLINPSFQQRVRRIAQTSLGPPLGLAYLASACREAGHEVRIVDANAEGLHDGDAAAEALRGGADVVGITATTPTVRQAGRIAQAVKRDRPDVPVLVGGPHTTALPARTLAELPAVDAVARGEGERALPAFLAALGRGGLEAAAGLPGFAVRLRDGTVADGGPAPVEGDMDSLPPPARDLLPMRRYRTVDSDAFTTMLAMRGCPCACVYCAVPHAAGRKLRHRSPAAVAAEMADVRDRFGVDLVSFVDDTFTWDRDWVEAFCEAVRSAELPRTLRWICLTRADRVDEPLLRAMRAAGCVRVEMGIESGSEKGRAYLRKGLEPGAVIEGFRAARAAGLSTMGFAILNIPGETAADVEATFDLVRRADPDFLQVSFLTPLPGTRLWDDAQARGAIATEDWERYRFLNDVVLRNDLLTETEVRAQYLSFVRRFYLRPRTVFKLARLVLRGTTRVRPLGRTVLHAAFASLGWRPR